MIFPKEQLIEALFNEYVWLCHDDYDPDVDIAPEDYLTMLKDMTYDQLVEETDTDEHFSLMDYVEAWGWQEPINLFSSVHLFGSYIGGNVLHYRYWIRLS